MAFLLSNFVNIFITPAKEEELAVKAVANLDREPGFISFQKNDAVEKLLVDAPHIICGVEGVCEGEKKSGWRDLSFTLYQRS
jgi:hypothetical protein